MKEIGTLRFVVHTPCFMHTVPKLKGCQVHVSQLVEGKTKRGVFNMIVYCGANLPNTRSDSYQITSTFPLFNRCRLRHVLCSMSKSQSLHCIPSATDSVTVSMNKCGPVATAVGHQLACFEVWGSIPGLPQPESFQHRKL